MRKNKIKKCAAALAFCAALCLPAQAANFTGSIDGNILSVELDSATAENGAMIYVLSGKFNADETITKQLLKERLVATGVINGSTTSLEMPQNAKSGLYTVVIGAGLLDAAKADRIIYVINAAEDEIAAAFEEMRGQTDADALFDKVSEYNNFLYIIDMTDLNENRQLFFELFGELNPTDAEGLKKLAATTSTLGGIKSKASDKLESILKENGDVISLDDFAAANTGDVAQTLARLRSNGEKLDSLTDIKAAVYKATALTAYNRHDNIIDTIKKYNDLFDVNFSYNGYSKVSQYELGKLLSVIVNDVDEVKPLFEKSVDKLAAEKKQSSSSGGGGSSSGGGGGKLIGAGVSVISGREDRPLDTDDKKDIFNDLGGYEWASDAVGALYKKGIVNGNGDGSFNPDRAVTREEFVKMAAIAFKLKSSERQSSFSDTADGEWYTPYIMSALEANVVNGISDNVFGIGMSITRQDAAVILRRALSESNTELDKTKSLIDFADYDSVSEYALSSVDYLARCGIINGFEDGSFRPTGELTRAEAAKMIYLCIKNI